jgi:pyrroloquinoline quinone biosynthesis protein E
MTGDAANADPVCELSPHHHLVTDAVAAADGAGPPDPPAERPLVFRSPANSARLFPATDRS